MTMRPLLIATLLLFTSAARAEPAVPTPMAQARARFQTGLQRAQQGDLVAALLEFEAAYATAPHFSVLYNIAQTRATLGRPVEAAAAFEQYLRDGGERIPEARREEVAALLESNRTRIGQLQLTAEPNTAIRAWLDGKELAREQLGVPILVPTGEHTVVFSNGEGFPESHVVTVSHAATTELRAAPKERAHEPEGVVQLAITCDVPEVDVEVNGELRGKTPITAPLLVPIGPVRLRFHRPGYVSATRSMAPTLGGLVTVSCGVRAAVPLPPPLAAALVIRAIPSDARVTIDGTRFFSGALPVGIHRLRVESDGHQPEARSISLAAGKPTVYSITLAPTATARDRQRRARARRATWGFVLGGTGAAFLATGIGAYAWNSGRYDDWHMFDPGNAQRAVSVQRVDDASFASIALGAALTLGGAWLIWGTD